MLFITFSSFPKFAIHHIYKDKPQGPNVLRYVPVLRRYGFGRHIECSSGRWSASLTVFFERIADTKVRDLDIVFHNQDIVGFYIFVF